MVESLTMSAIGVIHTPFEEQSGTPIQPSLARDTEGEVEVFLPYADGLADLDEFERIWLVFHLDRAKEWKPRVVPYLDTVERGLFSTRAPARPCPIGLSAVRLLSVSGNRLQVRGVDVLNGTPLLDIKPYVPKFDAHPDSAAGWLDRQNVDRPWADDRFEKPTSS